MDSEQTKSTFLSGSDLRLNDWLKKLADTGPVLKEHLSLLWIFVDDLYFFVGCEMHYGLNA
jgi:hypothetical protein